MRTLITSRSKSSFPLSASSGAGAYLQSKSAIHVLIGIVCSVLPCFRGSSLDSSIRELGIGKPLPPRESVRMPHEKSGRGCPLLVEPDTRAHAPRAFRTLSQPTLSPAIFRTGSPMEIENWRPAHAPTKASRWSNASSSSRSGSPYHDGAYYRTVSRARWTSADSDSEYVQ